MPAMINLQQYHLEEMLVAACNAHPLVDLRWKHRLVSLQQGERCATLTLETPDGVFTTEADWVIACDGANSDTRRMVGADFTGQFFQDRFLIADVVMEAGFPTERWFWFDPPFHRGQSVLLHKQSDNVWRIDFQLGWDADPEEEKKPEKVIPRIRAMLGPDREFDLEWVSVYTFQCRRMQRFRHGRVLFVGDAAHQVSPFGARGANSGLQDTDNLVWKLLLVMRGLAPEALLDSYSDERVAAADENLLNSTRSTDFITPKSQVSRDFRNAVLTLAREHGFARGLVNSGRLSVPSHLSESALNTPDADAFEGTMAPGAPLADAPVRADGRDGWLLQHTGDAFMLLLFAQSPADVSAATLAELRALADAPIPVQTKLVVREDTPAPAGCRVLVDTKGLAAERLDARPGTAHLLRPDQHVTARWRRLDAAAVRAAVARATCNA
jgi:3-(3-hydroxy-phenyl)propionate hydroxylase